MTSSPARHKVAGGRVGGQAGELRRDFTLRSACALAFAFISPIIALYSIFDLGLAAAGPSFWWAFAIVLAGQALVAVSLGELAARWPDEGGLAKWADRLGGEGYGWLTGWVYLWTLITLNVAAAYAATGFAAELLGLSDPSTGTRLALALVFLAAQGVISTWSKRLLRAFVVVAITCEVVGSLFVGTVLLLFHQRNDWSHLFDGPAGGPFALGPLLAAVAVVGWAFVGFESAGDIAEEVKDPKRAVPRAQFAALVLVGATVVYAALGLVLAVPEQGAGGADTILATLTSAFGERVVGPLMLVVCIGFLAGLAAVNTAASRVAFAMARDRRLPGSPWLRRTASAGVPRNALLTTSAASAAVLVLSVPAGVYDTLIAMSTAGFYLAFLLPAAALLVVRARGGWESGGFPPGRRLGVVVNAAAVGWLVFELVNICWPRSPEAPWHVEWSAPLMIGIVVVVGVFARGVARGGRR